MFTLSKQGAVDVVAGDDPLNTEFADSLSQVFDQCLQTGQPHIVLDLRNVSLIDSAGLELLLDVRDRCIGLGGLLQLAALNALCRDILQATGVASEFELFGSAIEAAGSFAQ